MRNKFDNFLLGTLWLLISTLGLCFWFNIRFGFNLFSASHWQHLSYMQATRTQISPSFYISLIIGVFFMILGLYIVIRPRFRKINLTSSTTETKNTTAQQTPVSQDTQAYDNYLSRPKRLNNDIQPAPVAPNPVPFTAPVVTNNTSPQAPEIPRNSHDSEIPELRNIFESTGYIVKKPLKIRGAEIPLVAIGINETVWIGAFDIETSTLRSVIDTMQQVFADTLEDIEIKTIGFVINASDATSPTASDILTFATLSDLYQYMHQHPNPPSDAETTENFEAFSNYITTVLEYIGRL